MFAMTDTSGKSLSFDDLDDDCLKLIFTRLTIREKLLIECVCVRWHRLIVQLLNGQQVIKIGSKSSLRNYYSCNDVNYFIHNCSSLRRNDDWISSTNITNDELSAVLVRCPNIKCLYLCDCFISASTLEWLISQLQRLVCVSLIAINGITSDDWPVISRTLSHTKLAHFTLSDNHFANFDISELISHWPQLAELHLAYYRQSLTDIFCQLENKICKLSLIECFRTNLVAMKALLSGNGADIDQLVVHKVPTYDENTLCEFICLKMTRLKRFSYTFDSQVPYITGLESLESAERLTILSNEEYGLNISALEPRVLSGVTHLQLNCHLDAKMVRSLHLIFPNIEKLDLSFDRICCDCAELTNDNVLNNPNPNPNNNNNNNFNNNGNNGNNNGAQDNNMVEADNDSEPYLDDNCSVCSEKFMIIISKLQNLKTLTLNGERIKDSAVTALEFCPKLKSIVIDKNCNELNLKQLLMTCVKLAVNNQKQIISVKINDKFFSRILNIKNMPKNFVILKHD